VARKRTVTDLEGVDDLAAAIKRLSEDVQGEHLRGAAAAGAEITRDVASQLAPVSADGSHGHAPGFLAAHIEAEVKFTRTQDKAEVHVGMHKDAWYGRLQETGTQFQPAQPFLRPALDATKDDVVAEIRDQLRARILRSP
jgi:HK97 gp10 family phage protein